MSSSSRTPLIIAIVVVVAAVAAIAAVLATRGGDDDAAAPSASVVDFGKVTVSGDPLAQDEGPDDPAIGTKLPTITGTDYAGRPTSIEPGKDGPLMIVVMAHWCPHCNREIPLLVDWKKSGKVPDGLQVVGVSTAVSSAAPNYPPGNWLDGLGWDWPVIADDEPQTAASALGTTGYPFLMFVDANGELIYRSSGEMPIEQVQQLADQTAATGR
jgi:cytochrome c biogenesis protein CcmG/thiol:disulfide interchange protein DsbE